MNLFQSFLMGGFECATHRRPDGIRLDVLRDTRHDIYALEDYRLLGDAGIRTVRDGLRWHRIEISEGVYDWSSFTPMLAASVATGTQVIWDLCHWGVPDDIDLFSEAFPRRFAAYAKAAAVLIQDNTDTTLFFCPINEISFWSWIGGDLGAFGPHQQGRGPEMKRQLVRASIAAIKAIRMIAPSARFVQAEPLIHILPQNAEDLPEIERYNAAQFEVCDMLAGRLHPELGGSPDLLDIVGVNYYWNNQWVQHGERVPLGAPRHRSLHSMLRALYHRYGRPLVITETGAEAEADIGWFGYILAEIRQAQREGADILGACIYPVMDYVGWDDERHCPCGLIEAAPDWTMRSLRPGLLAEVRLQEEIRRIASKILSEAPRSTGKSDPSVHSADVAVA